MSVTAPNSSSRMDAGGSLIAQAANVQHDPPIPAETDQLAVCRIISARQQRDMLIEDPALEVEFWPSHGASWRLRQGSATLLASSVQCRPILTFPLPVLSRNILSSEPEKYLYITRRLLLISVTDGHIVAYTNWLLEKCVI
jgi:hypothetical protein